MLRSMRVTLATISLALVCATAATAASPKVTYTGDRTLIHTLKLDDGLTGGPGYQRARWTVSKSVQAVMVVRNAKNAVVAKLVGGNVDSVNGALTWVTIKGQLVTSHAVVKPGTYSVTLTLTAFVPGMLKQLTDDSVVVSWSALVK